MQEIHHTARKTSREEILHTVVNVERFTYCLFGATALRASRIHSSERGTYALTFEFFLGVKASSFVRRLP